MPDEREITIEEDGQVVSSATVSAPDEDNEATAQVHVAPGHLPPGTRQNMAAAIHQTVTEDAAERLTAVVPRGDSELVEKISEQLSDAELRAAGATSIIRGQVRPGSC